AQADVLRRAYKDAGIDPRTVDYIEAHGTGTILGNHDGRSNGLIAPNQDAQADVLRRAYKDAGIDPRTVDYIEAHGTGTILG
ncbi:hypothetical protein GR254_24845, partial [Mycobacterium tuberculosis]|nr:hypothetical protein [Mycobacterium tuberculosis]